MIATKKLTGTAYHEAGHAVAGYAVGRAFTSVDRTVCAQAA